MQTSISQYVRGFTLFLLGVLGVTLLIAYIIYSKSSAPVSAIEKPVTPGNDFFSIAETLGARNFTPNTDIKFVFDRRNGKILYGKGWGNENEEAGESIGGTELWIANGNGSNPVRLVEGFDVKEAFFAPDGSIFYATRDQDLFRVSPDGTSREKILEKALQANVSPDGSKLVYQKLNPNWGIGMFTDDAFGLHLFNLVTRKETQLTTRSDDFAPFFTPSGNKIVFISAGWEGLASHFVIDEDGSNKTQLTNKGQRIITEKTVPVFSEKPIWAGKFMVYESDRQIWLIEFSETFDRVQQAKRIGSGIDPQWVIPGKTLEILPPPGDSLSAFSRKRIKMDLLGNIQP